jgi:hypothetical protein
MAALYMPETVNIRFTLSEECPIEEYLMDGIVSEYFPQEDGTFQVIIKDVDTVLLDSFSNPDELSEFLGIDPEFVIYAECLDSNPA